MYGSRRSVANSATLLGGVSSLVLAAALLHPGAAMAEALPYPVALHAAATTTAIADTAPQTPVVADPGGAPPPRRLNPTQRTVELTAPLRDGLQQLPEIAFQIAPDDSISVDRQTLIDALRTRVSPERIAQLEAALAGADLVSIEQVARAGYRLSYDPQTIAMVIDIPADARPVQTIQIAGFDRTPQGDFEVPAGFSAYLNIRSFIDYEWQGSNSGLGDPSALLDFAARTRGIVFEGEASFRPGGFGPTFVREGTRLVYDDRRRLARWTAGDLLPIGRGFSGAPQLAGVSVQRIYSIVDPLRLVQPTGDRTFTLTRPATVEAQVNGQQIRRIRLQPGVYNVTDLPFTQGANDVQFIIEDDAGGRETIRFTQFFDRTLLAAGLSEFSLNAGVLAPAGIDGRNYEFDDPAAAGWYRRGISDRLTLGGNFNVRESGAVVGVETVVATPLGTVGLDAAVSQNRGIGTGFVFNLGLQRTFGNQDGTPRTVSVSAEYRDRRFANPGSLFTTNPYSLILAASYGQAIGESQFISASGTYLIGRDGRRNETSARVLYGYALSARTNLSVEGSYEDREFQRNSWGVRVNLTMRVGRRSSAAAEIDSRLERARVSYQTSRGEGVGSWGAAADVDVGRSDVGVNASANYLANRFEAAAVHNSTVAINNDGDRSQRSALRLGTAIVFADGALALSRPVIDSFAMVTPHRSLGRAPVYLNPTDEGYSARSGALGGAVEPNLAAYFARNVIYDVPGAPLGYDLGAGAARVLPPYRGGYRIVAGSDYNITLLGTLVSESGAPVALLAGTARELSAPDREPVTVFTNREGRFAISGLRPGQWRIEMPTQPRSVVVITVPGDGESIVRLGEVRLGPGQEN